MAGGGVVNGGGRPFMGRDGLAAEMRFLQSARNIVEFMKPADESQKAVFLKEAESRGAARSIAGPVFDVLISWVRRGTLTLETKIYRDLGIIDEDLEETLFEIWEKTIERPITSEEISAVPALVTVSDIVLHINAVKAGKI
jgi:hypothetical protein